MKEDKEIMTKSILETAESASAYAEARLEKVRNEYQKRKIKMMKISCMMIIVSIVLVFATRSWFTMSRDVQGTDANMTASDLPFSIATKGANIRNQSIINSKRSEYVEGSSCPLVDTNNVSGTYYTDESLLLRYDTGASKIGPNGSGELSFYVIPKTNESTSVKILMNVVAFAKVEKKDASGNLVYKTDNNGNFVLDSNNNRIVDTETIEITTAAEFAAAANATTVNNSEIAAKAADYVKASDYLKGHIMFFGEKAASNADYLYTESYPNREIRKTVPANNKGKAVAIPINWMWTNTLGQITLKQADSKRDGKPVVQDLTNEQLALTTTEKAKVIKYVKDNKDDILANWTTILTAEELLQTVQSESNPDPKTISEVVDGLIDNMDVVDNFNRLSSCYNSADYAIGTKISYFMIEVTVTSGE